MKRVASVAAILGCMSAVWACGGSTPQGSDSPVGSNNSARSCARAHPKAGPVRANLDRQSSGVALAKQGDRTIAYVADADTSAIHTIDVDTARQIATTRVEGSPTQLLILADGRVAASLNQGAAIAVLEPGESPDQPLEPLCTTETPAEPAGMALTPDDSTLLVTTAWGHSLVAYDTTDLNLDYAVDVGRDARSVVVDDQGGRAFVSHSTGASISVVELSGKHEIRPIEMGVTKVTARSADQNERSGSQGYVLVKATTSTGPGSIGGEQPPVSDSAPKPAPKNPPKPVKQPPKPAPEGPIEPVEQLPQDRIFVPMTTVDPGDAAVRSQAYYGPVFDGVPKEAPIVSVIDSFAERSITRTKLSLGNALSQECILPRAAAYRASDETLYVACAGIDAVLELDTHGTDPVRLERRRFDVPSGPMGVAVDDAKSRLVVWSQFDGQVSIVNLDPTTSRDKRVALVNVSYEPSATVLASAAGRKMFHLTDDRRISNDGVACASCHLDGRDDAITWSTPDGPRQTIMLAGRMPNTAPYGWVGKHGDLKSYISNTFTRLGGSGLDTSDLENLILYLNNVPVPGTQNAAFRAPGDGDKAALVAHGRELFFSDDTACATCHVSDRLTDKVLHDVGSRANADVATAFDTPSLLFISGTGPYFHDGRYKTLDQMLSAQDSEMGHAQHLGRQDRAALAAYLESL
ncbi:MAG: hypothetical protein U0271_40550 [Polyangiaceae bacterium]